MPARGVRPFRCMLGRDMCSRGEHVEARSGGGRFPRVDARSGVSPTRVACFALRIRPGVSLPYRGAYGAGRRPPRAGCPGRRARAGRTAARRAGAPPAGRPRRSWPRTAVRPRALGRSRAARSALGCRGDVSKACLQCRVVYNRKVHLSLHLVFGSFVEVHAPTRDGAPSPAVTAGCD